MITPPTTALASGPVAEMERAVAQLRALEWLTRQPLGRLPLMVWFAHEDGGLVGSPADHSPTAAQRAFTGWVAHLQLVPDPPRHRGGLTRLRAQGRADGILITIHAEHRPDKHTREGGRAV